MPVPTWREDFDDVLLPAEWEEWDRCLALWSTSDGVLHQLSRCQGEGTAGYVRLGTVLVTAHDADRDGWFVARVYSGDDDGLGIVYGPSRLDYLRFSVRAETRTVAIARVQTIVKENGDFDVTYTPLTEATDDALPVRRWFELAVRRSDGVHELYVGGRRVATATAPSEPIAILGIYSYANVDLRVDWIASFPIDHVPWEPLP